MFNTCIRRVHQHSYDAMPAAPVDVREVVTAEASWPGVKAGVYGCAPPLVGGTQARARSRRLSDDLVRRAPGG